jgi:serine/threonine protein phosphatase 1
MRVYAVGDVHGRRDLLDDLFEKIREDMRGAPPTVLTVFLDRGPDSAGVIDRLSKSDAPTPFCALRGNHEEVLLEFLENETILESWRRFGGLETLHSYGVDVSEPMRGRGYDKARRALLDKMPAHHREFLERTPYCVAHGDYFFVHAGVRPGVPLHLQRREDMLWIRDDFLDSTEPWPKVIVHGHTPVTAPTVLPNRINIDTGAFVTSVLTALVLEGAGRRFLQVRGG